MHALPLIFSTLCALVYFNNYAYAQEQNIRVASTSLCADTYLAPHRANVDIIALSWQSDHAISNTPIAQRTKQKAWDSVERLLALHPDLVIFGPGEGVIAKPILDENGIKHINLIWGEDFETVDINYNTVRTALNLDKIAPPAKTIQVTKTEKPQILYLTAAGATAGTGTYVDAAIIAAGGINIITKQGWHTPDPENIAALTPDLIITSFFGEAYMSANQAGLRNKVLQDKLHTSPRLSIPGKLWPCAGPGLYRARDMIAAKIKELNP